MSEPRLPLDRLLAEEAERGIPADLDLWPGVSQRLKELGFDRQAATTANEPVQRSQSTHRRAVQTRPLDSIGGWWRPNEVLGNAISFGLGALAIAVIAIVVGWPSRDEAPRGFGAGTPEQGNLAGSTPSVISTTTLELSDSAIGTTVNCTFDLDISPEARSDRVVIPVQASANGSCGTASTLRLAIVDHDGKRPQIAGSPLNVPLNVEDDERWAEVSVVWTNWCGTSGRYRIETQFGSERHTLPLPAAPRCVDQERPSTLHLQTIEARAASATPEVPATQGTPIP